VIQGMSTARKRLLVLGLLALTVAAGFTLRTALNHDAATTDDGEVLLSGNDPYYYQHAVDHILETGETIKFDEMLNFPAGSVNPNPPLFMWSVAVGGEIAGAVTGGDGMGLSLLYTPSVWGALTIVPAYLIGRDLAGKWGGLLAGFLVATSPEHMSRTALGFADHEALYLFLVATGMYYVMSALRRVGTPTQHTNIREVWGDYLGWFSRQRSAAGAAVVAGAMFGGVALTWKGFPYVFGIMLAYGGLQFLMNHWRGRDVARPMYVLATTSLLALAMSIPYYLSFDLMHFWNPGLYLTIALLASGLFLLGFQRYPAVLAIPGLLVLGAGFATIMLVVFPDLGAALLNRFVYFQDNALYQTISEARPSSVSNLSFAVGPVPFFLYITGFFWLVYRVYDETRPAEIFFLSWALVDLFMAVSAVRFLFTSSVTMAVLAATTLIWLIRAMDLPSIREGYKRAGGGLRGLRRATGVMHILLVVFVLFFVLVPNGVIGVDAAVPSDITQDRVREGREAALEAATAEAREQGLNGTELQEVQNAVNQSRSPDQFDSQLRDLAERPGSNLTTPAADAIVAAAEPHLETVSTYSQWFGAFGQTYLPASWQDALGDLAERDTEEEQADRPAAISWWDYGHWTIAEGNHPAVADNFQHGYRASGNFLVAQNETHGLQILGERYTSMLDSETFEQTLTEHGLDEVRAEAITDLSERNEYPYIPFHEDREENRATTVEWLSSIEERTGKEIRYVITDNRMLPVDNPNSQQIENPSIFYAPVTLAEKDPDNYVEDSLVNLGTGEKMTQEELRQLQRQNPDQQPSVGQRLFYKSAFFESMYYRSFVGLPAREPISQGGQQFPIPFNLASYPEFYEGEEEMLISRAGSEEVNGLAITQETAPGFGLRHFRLVHGNQDVRTLEYTPGATVDGTVTVAGEPLEDVRVTAFDDAGEQVFQTNPSYYERRNRTAEDLDVPHDSTTTDANGTYELVSPFGTDRGVDIRVTKIPEQRGPSLGGGPSAMELDNRRVNITREEAERDERFEIDFEIPPANLTGTTFLDENTNGEREEGEPVVQDVDLELQQARDNSGADGVYRLEDLKPGSYSVNATAEDHRVRPGAATVTLEPGQTVEHDIALEHEPVPVNGTVVDDTGSPLENVETVFEPAANDSARQNSATSEIDGNVSIDLQPGTYEVGGNGTPPGSNTTLEVTSVEVTGGTGATAQGERGLSLDPDARDVQLRITAEPVDE